MGYMPSVLNIHLFPRKTPPVIAESIPNVKSTDPNTCALAPLESALAWVHLSPAKSFRKKLVRSSLENAIIFTGAYVVVEPEVVAEFVFSRHAFVELVAFPSCDF